LGSDTLSAQPIRGWKFLLRRARITQICDLTLMPVADANAMLLARAMS